MDWLIIGSLLFIIGTIFAVVDYIIFARLVEKGYIKTKHGSRKRIMQSFPGSGFYYGYKKKKELSSV